MSNPNNTIPPHDPHEPVAPRKDSYILPLVIVAIMFALGIIFFTSGDNIDDLAATAPAAGEMQTDSPTGRSPAYR